MASEDYDTFFLLPAIMNMTVFSLKSYGPLGELIWKQCLLLPTKPTKFCAQTDLETDNMYLEFFKKKSYQSHVVIS